MGRRQVGQKGLRSLPVICFNTKTVHAHLIFKNPNKTGDSPQIIISISLNLKLLPFTVYWKSRWSLFFYHDCLCIWTKTAHWFNVMNYEFLIINNHDCGFEYFIICNHFVLNLTFPNPKLKKKKKKKKACHKGLYIGPCSMIFIYFKWFVNK